MSSLVYDPRLHLHLPHLLFFSGEKRFSIMRLLIKTNVAKISRSSGFHVGPLLMNFLNMPWRHSMRQMSKHTKIAMAMRTARASFEQSKAAVEKRAKNCLVNSSRMHSGSSRRVGASCKDRFTTNCHNARGKPRICTSANYSKEHRVT